jgi:hypothetical protein
MDYGRPPKTALRGADLTWNRRRVDRFFAMSNCYGSLKEESKS